MKLDGDENGYNAPMGVGAPVGTGMSNENEFDGLRKRIEELEKLVLAHENALKEKKTITNTYVDAILSKIEILKNIIQKDIGYNDDFISQHLIMVETIEDQVKSTGKISDKQFEMLNDIYKKQQRL